MATAGAGDEASVSISREDSSHVEMAIRILGLLPRKKGIKGIFQQAKKLQHPQKLVENATFTRWVLTSSSLDYEAKISQQHHSDQTSVSKLRIRKFPSDLDDLSIEVSQPAGRNFSFLIIRGKKRPPAIDWKRFLSDNGTLDAGQVEEESEVVAMDKETEDREKREQKEQQDTERPRRSVYQENLKKTW